MRKLGMCMKIFYFQKRIVSAESIRGNTVSWNLIEWKNGFACIGYASVFLFGKMKDSINTQKVEDT